jgi:hypothetical protein
MEYIVFARTCFTLCQNHYGSYVRIPGRTSIPDGDGMDPSTREHAVRRAWAPTTSSYLARH